LSSLLRAHAVALLDAPSSERDLPRVFGRRLLREGQVGLEQPVKLNAPATPRLRLVTDEAIEEEPPMAPPPDFAAMEEEARVRGYTDGQQAGYAAGLQAAEQAAARMLQQLSALVGQVHENHSTFFRAAERQVVDLALQIAQKVVEREIENMPDLAVNVIRAALEEMDARTAVRVRINPDDEELLRRRWSQVVPTGLSPQQLEVVVDDRVQAGGAIIETTQGQVDAQLDTKLAQLGSALWTFVTDTASESQVEEQEYAA
jgi:flagellar biosynthesis/type III secretory pathway protein FliH